MCLFLFLIFLQDAVDSGEEISDPSSAAGTESSSQFPSNSLLYCQYTFCYIVYYQSRDPHVKCITCWSYKSYSSKSYCDKLRFIHISAMVILTLVAFVKYAIMDNNKYSNFPFRQKDVV